MVPIKYALVFLWLVLIGAIVIGDPIRDPVLIAVFAFSAIMAGVATGMCLYYAWRINRILRSLPK